MAGLVLDIVIVFVVRMIMNLWRDWKARKWPITSGRVTSRSLQEHGYSFVELKYRYKWDGERYTGVFREPYMIRHSKTFDQARADSEISIRVNPEDPSKSIPVNV